MVRAIWAPLLVLAARTDAISISDVYPTRGSVYGGTYLVISGSGFQFPMEYNPWDAQSVFVGAVPCKTIPHYTDSVRIVCITGPSPGFQTTNYIDVTVQLYSGIGDAQYARLPTVFRYDSYNSATLMFARAWAGSGGDMLSFAAEIQPPVASAEQLEIKVGDSVCQVDQETYPLMIDQRRPTTLKLFSCELVNDIMLRPGRYNVSLRMRVLDSNAGECPNSACFPRTPAEGKYIQDGYGFAAVQQQPPVDVRTGFDPTISWGGGVDLATGTAHLLTVYPEVDSVSPTAGGVYGGNLLTITGTSFSANLADNIVTVGGVPCQVVQASPSQLVCQLGNRANYTGGTGGTLRGLYFASYRNVNPKGPVTWNAATDTIPPMINRTLIQEGLLKAQIDFVNRVVPYSSDLDGTNENYLREEVGYFVPPLTANYTFYIAGDDVVTLELGSSSAMSSLRRIATCATYVSWADTTEVSPSTFYVRAFTDGGPLFGNTSQISTPIPLVAGSRYAFRLRHTAYTGGEWVRFGLKVSGLYSATTSSGSGLSDDAIAGVGQAAPAMEVQRLRLTTSPTLRREMHFIQVSNITAGGNYALSITSSLGLNAVVRLNANAVSNDIRNAFYGATVQQLGAPTPILACRSLSVTSADSGGGRTFNVSLNCPIAPGMTRHITLAVVDATKTTVSVGLKQSGSLPIGGTFKVGFDGVWSGSMDATNSNWATIAQQLSTFLRRDDPPLRVEVWPTLIPWPQSGEGFDFIVRFRRPLGDVPPLSLDLSRMTGQDWQLTVQTVEDGDIYAAMIDRVPADYFELPPPSDPNASTVRVVTLGVLASTSAINVPTYTYSNALTPVLASVSPSLVQQGSTLTVQVDNIVANYSDPAWLSGVVISLGRAAACSNVQDATSPTTASRRVFTCTVQLGQGGQYPVYFFAPGQGQADPSRPINTTYDVRIDSFSPSSGSQDGGTLVTIIGDGFLGAACSSITIGGVACSEPSAATLATTRPSISALPATQSAIVCLTPALPGGLGTQTQVSKPFSFALPLGQAKTIGTFLYTAADTPTVAGITPTSRSGALSGNITISGQVLACGAASTSCGTDAPIVTFGSRSCQVSSFSATQISCWLQRYGALPQDAPVLQPTIWVPGKGYAHFGAGVSFTSRFQVQSVSPSAVSRGGGAVLTLTGQGFHPTDPSQEVISLTLDDGSTRDCTVLDGTSTRIRCRLEGGIMKSGGRRLAEAAAAAKTDPNACKAGGHDGSKARCFAQALLAKGTVRAPHAEQPAKMAATFAQLAVPVDYSRVHVGSWEEAQETPDGIMLGGRRLADAPVQATASLVLSGTTAKCADSLDRADNTSCQLSITPDATAVLLGVTPTSGSYADGTVLYLTVRSATGLTQSAVHVYLGSKECPVTGIQTVSLSDGPAYKISVSLCAFQASTVPVLVWVDPIGYAQGGSPYTGTSFTFRQLLRLTSMDNAAVATSPYGGAELVFRGYGFGATPNDNRVTVGSMPCQVVNASLTEVRCYAPPQPAGVNVSQPAVLSVLNAAGIDSWSIGSLFSTCDGSQFAADPGAEPEPDPEPSPMSIMPQPVRADFGSSSFTISGAGVMRMQKAACSSNKGVLGEAETTVPQGVMTFIIDFKIEQGCTASCSPLWVTLVDPADATKYFRWCFNRRTSGDCDVVTEVPESSWQRYTFTVASFQAKQGYVPTGWFKLRLGIYADSTSAATLVEPVVFNEPARAINVTYALASAAPTALTASAVGTQELQVFGANFSTTEVGIVALGTSPSPYANFVCRPTMWNATYIRCTLPLIPAGGWMVRAWSPTKGWSAPPPSLFWVSAAVAQVTANGVTINTNATDPWVLVMKIAATPQVFTWASTYWTSTATLSETSAPAEPLNAKYPAFNTAPFRRLRICVDAPQGNCVDHTFASNWSSARALFSAGEVIDKGMDQNAVLRAFNVPVSAYQQCPAQRPGVNVQCAGGNRARFGFCTKCPNSPVCLGDGDDSDAAIGIGLTGKSTSSMGAGWTGYFAPGATSCSPNSATGKNVWVYVENLAAVTPAPSLSAGVGGGVQVTLKGTGLGFEPGHMQMYVCNEPCKITSASAQGNSVTCTSPVRRTPEAAAAYPSAFPAVDLAPFASRFYTDKGEAENFVAQGAFTNSVDTQVNLFYNNRWNTRTGCWFGFELPFHKRALVTSVQFFPPTNQARRIRTSQSVFEVRNNTGTLSNWTVIANMSNAVITGYTIAQRWNTFAIDPPVSAQAFRLRILPDACQTAGELLRGIRFTGVLLDAQDSAACPIELRRVMHPLASAGAGYNVMPVTLAHSLSITPVVTSISPNSGTARGGTQVVISGSNLSPLFTPTDGSPSANITFNTYNCRVTAITAVAITCVTAPRDRGIMPPSTQIWISGRGNAVVAGANSQAATFQYIDKWNDQYSWKDSEMPVEGDSVIVPEGQAILLDQDSPILFFVLVSGLLEFDRKDLNFQSTYLWVHGGQLKIGTEEVPFLNKATITLHGDRWNTIELPFIGCKNLVVTNAGGLNANCHTADLRDKGVAAPPCPVRSVGKIDIHGKPGVSWTRLVQTVNPGATTLQLEESVNWDVGSSIVITPSKRGETEELRLVKSVSGGGYIVEVDRPLSLKHLGEWYFHPSLSAPIDLRAAVGLRTRNVKIQGDESSLQPGNSYSFGAHVAAFFGGELRIENTEFTRTGQTANFGRYSSHWHMLSPGRSVDVIDKAYLRNNSYHDTFQRAIVIHGTDYATAKHNVAHRSKGHSFFTEAGDEFLPLWEHNLAVNPQPHPVLLDDDMDPAGFWAPGFIGVHRNNMAANAVRGWRIRKLSGTASEQTDMTFFNNSAHACSFGWHLKPPHIPRTLNTFEGFTAFRCETGMFYYGTGNIRHDNHRFVECGTGHFQNHHSQAIWQPPFYTDLVLVGNINSSAGWSRSGLGIRTPKDSDDFFISGMTVINFYSTPVLYGCFETACTMRFERTRWIQTYRRTTSDPWISGMYWDLDGTMTGFPNGFVTWDTAFNHFPGLCNWTDPSHVNGVVCGLRDGSLRMRRLIVEALPWQLDGKDVNATTSAGRDSVRFAFKKLWGWPVMTVEGQPYDLRFNDPNDFTSMNMTYGYPSHVMQAFGWSTPVTPKNETLVVHWNFTSWRNHFEGTVGQRLSRMPQSSDPFGSYSMLLAKDGCDAFKLTPQSAKICNGQYINETGWQLKQEIDVQFKPQPIGRLTTVFASHTALGSDGQWRGVLDTPRNLSQTFTPRECPVTGCPTPDRGPGSFGYCRNWSDPAGWPNQTLPAAGQHVTIQSSDCVTLDIRTPILNWVTVQGKLNFSGTGNTSLNCKGMRVWGVFEIGTLEAPYPAGAYAEVVLWGLETDPTVVMVDGLFLGNNVIGVLGSISAVGSPSVPTAWTKLATTAQIGATSITVRGNVASWPVGARIGISPTEFPQPSKGTTEAELRVIAGTPVYDPVTNTTAVPLTQGLNNRHFAGNVTGYTEGVWPGAVLAAAVALLDGRSNVVFRTSNPETPSGPGIVVGGSSNAVWMGSANFSDVDFIGMGKFAYQAPALQFLYLSRSIGNAPPSLVQRCVFVQSQAGGIQVTGGGKIQIVGNVFFRNYRTAVWVTVESVANAITLNGNLAIETLRHPRETVLWVRSFASFFIEVPPKELLGNIAAGSTDTGFLLRPIVQRDCSKDYSQDPPLAEGQSNEAVACLVGFFLLRSCDGACTQCAQLRGAIAWKNAHIGITTVDNGANLRLDTVIVADNHVGIALNFLRPFADLSHRVYGRNITVLGSTPASTCNASTVCRAMGEYDLIGATCNSVVGSRFRRIGMMGHMVNSLAKLCEANPMLKQCRPPSTPVKLCVLPWEHREGPNGNKYSEGVWTNITFGSFQGSDCGMQSVGFTLNPTSVDINYPQRFSGVQWLSSADPAARIFMNDPGITVNKVTLTSGTDGLNSASLIDMDGTLLGSGRPGGTAVSASNPALATQDCEARIGYYACPNLKLRHLRWEGIEDDPNREEGSMQALRLSDNRSTWSRGPFGEFCLTMVDPRHDRHFMANPRNMYNLTMFAAPPRHHALYWLNEDPEPIRVSIFLTQPFALQVYVDGALMNDMLYDKGKTGRYPNLTDPHGSYAFDPWQRRFFITLRGGTFNGKSSLNGGGNVLLRLIQVVQLSLSMQVSLANFDASQQALINNIATLLKIDPKRIKIVSVQSSAQIAGQTGFRRLQDVAAAANTNVTAKLLVQIMEANPPPLPAGYGNSSKGNVTTTTKTTTLARAQTLDDILGNLVLGDSNQTLPDGVLAGDLTDSSASDGADVAAAAITAAGAVDLIALANQLQTASAAGQLGSGVALADIIAPNPPTTTTTQAPATVAPGPADTTTGINLPYTTATTTTTLGTLVVQGVASLTLVLRAGSGTCIDLLAALSNDAQFISDLQDAVLRGLQVASRTEVTSLVCNTGRRLQGARLLQSTTSLPVLVSFKAYIVGQDADVQQAVANMASPTFQTLFVQRLQQNPKVASVTVLSVTQQTPTARSAQESQKSNVSVGAIIAIVVACVVVGTAAGCIIDRLYCHKPHSEYVEDEDGVNREFTDIYAAPDPQDDGPPQGYKDPIPAAYKADAADPFPLPPLPAPPTSTAVAPVSAFAKTPKPPPPPKKASGKSGRRKSAPHLTREFGELGGEQPEIPKKRRNSDHGLPDKKEKELRSMDRE